MKAKRNGRRKRNTEEKPFELPSPCDRRRACLLVRTLPGQTQAGLSRVGRLEGREADG